MKKKNILIGAVVAIILIIISVFSILANGKEGVYNVQNFYEYSEQHIYSDVRVEFEDEGIAEYIGFTASATELNVRFYYIGPGKTFFTVYYNDNGQPQERMDELYSYKPGILSLRSRIGDINGSLGVILSILAFMLFVVIALIIGLRKSVKENLYSYKNALLLSGLIFSGLIFIMYLFVIISSIPRAGIISFIDVFNNLGNIPNTFSLLFALVLIIIFLLISISNIQLIRREGAKGRNLLGIIFGFAVILFVLVSVFASDLIFWNIFIPMGLNGDQVFITIYNYTLMFISTLIAYFESLFIGISLFGIITAKHAPKFDKDFIVILGCSIAKDGSLLPLIRGRVDRALEFNEKQKILTGKSAIFIPSGGKGSDEIISEARAMANYMLSKGIDKDQIILEDQSENTYQNLQNSKKIIEAIKPDAKIAFSTTNYHVLRAGIYSTAVGVKAEGMGAKTKWYFWPNAFLREFVAVMKFSKRSHIIFAIGAFIIIFLLALVSYFGGLL